MLFNILNEFCYIFESILSIFLSLLFNLSKIFIMKKFIICLLLTYTSIFSQNATSLTQKDYILLQEKVRSFSNSNIDSAFIYSKKIEKSANYTHKAFAYAARAYLFQLREDIPKSKQSYSKALFFLDRIPPSKEKRILKSNILNYGGLTDWNRDDLKNALDKFQKGLVLAKEEEDQIQILKFNMNISLILTEVGNFNAAIFSLKESEKSININKDFFSKDKFNNYKSNINYYLGNCYEKAFGDNRFSQNLLDSARTYYKKAILYSKNYPIIKVNCQLSLGNISYLKRNFMAAEKTYYDVLLFSRQNDLKAQYLSASYSLGNLFFELKKYDKALLFFQKVDSIHKLKNNYDSYYVNSNYYQAKIYAIKNDPRNAVAHSKIYLTNFEKNQSKFNDQVLEVNYSLGNVNVKKEIQEIKSRNEKKVFLNDIVIFFFMALFFVLIILYTKSIQRKKNADKKYSQLIEEFKLKQNPNYDISNLSNNLDLEKKDIKGNPKLTLDIEKEEEIFEKLKVLESKGYYLNEDFTQQWVAKKIKTNTSYLSYVVNKRFGKSFSEYSNELKINYVINELITNPKYRKYSTQALAESVGFKNAVSFTKSFSKRTGITPIQFTKRLQLPEK
jgi:AraC-like DNA-binding protein